MMIGLQCLNFYWLYMILNGLYRVLTKGKSETTFGSRDADTTKVAPKNNKIE